MKPYHSLDNDNYDTEQIPEQRLKQQQYTNLMKVRNVNLLLHEDTEN